MNPRIDFTSTLADYAHRPSFPPELFECLRACGIPFQAQRILDLGAGTGLLAKPMTLRGASVTAIDVSHPFLLGARQIDAAANVVLAPAENLPFADASFDLVTAAQCWHWFDRRRAPSEALRVLKPGHPIAVIYQMHVPLPGTIAERSEQLILRHNPRWRHANSAGINGQVLRDLQIAGFAGIESFSFDVEHVLRRQQWQAIVRTSSGVAPSMSPAQLEAFDRDHAAMLAAEPPEFSIPHRIFAAVATRPRGSL